MVVSAIAKGPPNYKYAKGGAESLGYTWERSGHSGGPLCGLLQGGVPAPLAGSVASAQLGRHDTENPRKPLLYALLRLPRLFEATIYLSFATIARNEPTQELATNFCVSQKD